MVYVYLNGRFGNYLFQVATGLSLSKDITLIAPSEKIYKEILKYPDVFGKFQLLRTVPSGVNFYQEKSFHYEDIPYDGKDLIIKGNFQSYKYVKIRPNLLFNKQPETVKEFIKAHNIAPSDYVGIHVRRGDYLKLPHRHPFCGLKYYQKAIRSFPEDTRFLVCSDDLDWCRKRFQGDRFLFVDSNSAIMDFYLMSMCNSNIISNSTFSWWTAFINHENKRIIAPSRWFGLQLKSNTTKDLYLPQTEVINVNYSLGLLMKSLLMILKDNISKTIHRYK